MKINFSIEADQDEIVELMNRMGFACSPNINLKPEVRERSYAERAKPSEADRNVIRNFHRQQMERGHKPLAPLFGDWSDYYEPHELGEDGPLPEIFNLTPQIVSKCVKHEMKRVARRKPKPRSSGA